MMLSNRCFIFSITALAFASSLAHGESTLKAYGKAHQDEYRAQKKLGPGATAAQRQAVSQAAFAEARAKAGEDITRKNEELAKTQLKFLKSVEKAATAAFEQRKKDGLTTPGVKGEEAKKLRDARRAKLDPAMLKARQDAKDAKANKNGKKDGGKGTGKDQGKDGDKNTAKTATGASGTAGASGASGKRAGNPATEVTGADGATEVDFGAKKGAAEPDAPKDVDFGGKKTK